MKKATKNGIDHIITVTNEDNERQVEQMVGKAMCAYANWMVARECVLEDINKGFEAEPEKHRAVVAHKSEYEATVLCIGMFVDQPTSYICQYVIARAKEELGI